MTMISEWSMITMNQNKLQIQIITWISLGKSEICNPLFIQSQVPSYCNVVLSLLGSNIKKI